MIPQESRSFGKIFLNKFWLKVTGSEMLTRSRNTSAPEQPSIACCFSAPDQQICLTLHFRSQIASARITKSTSGNLFSNGAGEESASRI